MWIVGLKEIGQLKGKVVVRLLESVLSSLKKCVELCLCEIDSTVLIRACV